MMWGFVDIAVNDALGTAVGAAMGVTRMRDAGGFSARKS
jgi:hypothetical protein